MNSKCTLPAGRRCFKQTKNIGSRVPLQWSRRVLSQCWHRRSHPKRLSWSRERKCTSTMMGRT
eukprot:10619657-Ditylum_brightwellii.AAC.1